jgi:hypothetical protein
MSTKWLIALAVWAGLLVLLWVGPKADPWVQAFEWTAVALLCIVAIWSWRGGMAANVPERVRRWMTDDDNPSKV